MSPKRAKSAPPEKEDFSPGAQAVSDAANKAYWDWGNLCPADAHTIASAALQAAAEFPAFTIPPGRAIGPEYMQGFNDYRDYLRSIASELEEK